MLWRNSDNILPVRTVYSYCLSFGIVKHSFRQAYSVCLGEIFKTTIHFLKQTSRAHVHHIVAYDARIR